jgi:hypothetical protein
VCGWVWIEEAWGENGVHDRKENAKHYNMSQHDSERREEKEKNRFVEGDRGIEWRREKTPNSVAYLVTASVTGT